MNGSQTLFERCFELNNQIPGDFGGGSPLEKTFLMADLVNHLKLKCFVEIGVYRGKSFFPVAQSIMQNGGRSYGIDPYSPVCAKEKDVDENLRQKIDAFVEQIDWNALYDSVIKFGENNGFGESTKIIRSPSREAASYFKRYEIVPDMLHIDGNHDTECVRADHEDYFPLLKEGSIIVFDDINWPSVRPVYEHVKTKCREVFVCDTFGILLKESGSTHTSIKVDQLKKRCMGVYERTRLQLTRGNSLPVVSIGIFCYNHLPYIEECIRSVVSQMGPFFLKVIICDDCSSDGTSEKIMELLPTLPKRQDLLVEYHRNAVNLGIMGNLKQMWNLLKHSDFCCIVDGDDYFAVSDRIIQHLSKHIANPQIAISYNRVRVYDQREERFVDHFAGDAPIIDTRDIIKQNLIGTISAAFYNSEVLRHIEEKIFEFFAGDWFSHTLFSQYGDVAMLDECTSVYRRHEDGFWSGMPIPPKIKTTIEAIDFYNKYFNFSFDKEYTIARNSLSSYAFDGKLVEDNSILILDDFFPNPLSGFRYQEFVTLLEVIPDSKALVSLDEYPGFFPKSKPEMVIDFKRKYPHLANRVQLISEGETVAVSCKLIYLVFLNNAFKYLKAADSKALPFVFTLYPGGGFVLNNRETDEKLKFVLSSPKLRKVIVTQRVILDYLTDKNWCAAEKIEFIFGGIPPEASLNRAVAPKESYGLTKDTLDICFVANRYTAFGEDKGYDVFLDAAKRLSLKYDNITFHVVGAWDETVLDTTGIRNLRFYGLNQPEWFEGFYQNMDIIVSPNRSNRSIIGAFDGFPLTTCLDAALYEVAVFCSDPLNLNEGRFREGEDIVIIKSEPGSVVEQIEHYLAHPQKLSDLARSGCGRAKELFGHQAQLAPRIAILTEECEKLPVGLYSSSGALGTPYNNSLFRRIVRKVVPPRVRMIYHKTREKLMQLRIVKRS